MESTNRRKKMSPEKRRKKRINKAFKVIGEVLVGIQILATIVFIGLVWRLGMVPPKYIAGVAAIFLVFAALLFTMQIVTRGKALLSKLVSILMSTILILGSVYLYRTHDAVEKISGDEIAKQVDSMLVVVRSDDPAEKVTDTADYLYGMQRSEPGGDAYQTLEKVNAEVGTEVITAEYNTLNEQAGALLDGSVQAMIYNEGFTGILDEVYGGFSDMTKVVAKYDIESEIDTMVSGKAAKVDVKDSAFSMYISGIDVYGSVSTKSRSDVNIIATVNPETKQILLVNTPRDYYVPIPGVSGESRDKLTHAGIYGVDKSIASLEELYDVEIPFYTRVNFTSLITMVDLIGGVDVNSEHAFTSDGSGGAVITVTKGMNHFNGEEALAFARERHSLPDGDNDRGKNQMAVINAMFQKMIAPEMLAKAPSLLNKVSDSVEMNMSMAQIQDLIQHQLNEGGTWTIKSVAAEGTGGNDYCYSMPGVTAYVTRPDDASVENIKNLIKMVENGEFLPDESAEEPNSGVGIEED